ncbi:Extracellular solute-binding protein precursor [Propionibacterium freudenreichii subsp. freudenreichii]|uniref:Extracellular solute-binding protein n=1 Tax=Propionibacterium freudenreichii subsp. freudenreichii TaxID=66712 RepID=A0A0B7NZ09_PROFF|nr:Extracellular solute-binding protein precursor [Propionibacterium freudenreichii subsp. freudenreichii]
MNPVSPRNSAPSHSASSQGSAAPHVLSTTLSRRRLLSMAALGAGAVALAACAGPSTSSGASSSAADANGPDFSGVTPATTITFWSNHPGSSEDITKQIISDFKNETGITVNLVTAGSSYEDVAQKFQTAQTGGTLPDIVVFSDVWWFRYYMQDSIIPLTNALKAANVDTSDYRDGLFADYQYKGSQWAVPWARSTPLFYYNKSHWAAAGLPDRVPATWDEFAQWAPKLKDANSSAQHVYEHPALADYAGWTLQNILWGYGGGWSAKGSFDVTCDSEASVKALQYVKDSVYQGKWAGVASSAGTDDLAAGACSATLGSTGSLVGVQKAAAGKFEVGVGNLPGGPSVTTPVCPTGGAGVGSPRRCRRPTSWQPRSSSASSPTRRTPSPSRSRRATCRCASRPTPASCWRRTRSSRPPSSSSTSPAPRTMRASSCPGPTRRWPSRWRRSSPRMPTSPPP